MVTGDDRGIRNRYSDGPSLIMKSALKFGLMYFLVVFTAGFLLAPLREWFLVPRMGRQWAELSEMPLMLLVMYVAAGWLARRTALNAHPQRSLVLGFFALGIMLAAEFAVLTFARGLSLQQYIDQREPVSGMVYVLMLLLFALLPWLRHLDAGTGPAPR